MNRKDRILIVNKLGNIGSNINDFDFLIDKLRNGNVGDKVGAAASFRDLPLKEAFNDLLSKVNYIGHKGFFVRFRVVDALNALLKLNKLDLKEIELLRTILITQQRIETDDGVKDYINIILVSLNAV